MPGREVVQYELECEWCGNRFRICRSEYHGQAYCQPKCRTLGEKFTHGRANGRHQSSEEGRQDHQTRQEEYRERQLAKAKASASDGAISPSVESRTTVADRPPDAGPDVWANDPSPPVVAAAVVSGPSVASAVAVVVEAISLPESPRAATAAPTVAVAAVAGGPSVAPAVTVVIGAISPPEQPEAPTTKTPVAPSQEAPRKYAKPAAVTDGTSQELDGLAHWGVRVADFLPWETPTTVERREADGHTQRSSIETRDTIGTREPEQRRGSVDAVVGDAQAASGCATGDAGRDPPSPLVCIICGRVGDVVLPAPANRSGHARESGPAG